MIIIGMGRLIKKRNIQAEFQFIHREGNQVARVLARYAIVVGMLGWGLSRL